MSEFVRFLDAVFEHFGPIRSHRMFGGYGIYHNDLMFALVADDELYLKVDTDSVVKFEELGLAPFEYSMKDGRVSTMSYCRAPEGIFDDPEQATYWANLAYDAALRSAAKKAKKKAKK